MTPAQPAADRVTPAQPAADTFVAAAAHHDSDRAEALQRELESSQPIDDRETVIRSLTAAARALRRSVGQEADPSPITDGDAAFDELVVARGLRLDRGTEEIQKHVVAALALATDRLGPFPGGRLGKVKNPVAEVPIAEEVRTTSAELVQMATSAGAAVGLAGARGAIDSIAEVREVVH